jgi:hypothetical protein
VVSHITKSKPNEIDTSSTIVITKDDLAFYIKDQTTKLIDISKMPKYIQDDWILQNRQKLDIDLMKYFLSLEEDEDRISQLKVINRNILIEKIL